MRAKEKPVLESGDLNDADEAILDELQRGRATPQHLASEIETDRSYVNQRLKRLVEHGHVVKLAPGLYELRSDPREDGVADLYAVGGEHVARVEGEETVDVDALRDERDRLDAEVDRLEDALADARAAGDADALEEVAGYLEAALDALPADVPGRAAVEDARATVERLREGGDE